MDSSFFPLLVAANKYRILDYDLPPVFGMPSGPLIVLGLIIASIVIGILMANSLRLRDYGWKLGLILSTVSVTTFVVLFGDFKLGVDLKGGVILVYEVNELESKQLQGGREEAQFNMSQLTGVITKRLNPTGLKEIVVRPFGPKQVEIVVPEVDPKEIEDIKEKIRTGGVLQFMIVATEDRDGELFGIARDQATKEGDLRLQRFVVDSDGRQVGYWATLGREKDGGGFRALETLDNALLRDGTTGEILEVAREQKRLFAQSSSLLERFLQERNVKRLDVLMVYDADFAIRGDDLSAAYPGHDESFRPAIHFTMRTEGAIKMGHVTSENLQRKLAIIFDNELLSAPVIQSKISEQGQITGNFTQEEVDFIVGILKSGSMPVVMQKEPISENQIGSILGRETVQQGSRSVLIASALVFLFMAVYYRFSGLVACFALALNLGLTVAIMVALQAPFTLPGLAGLVLTLAMSVDANVLISERMREEVMRGAALRMAIRNGFDKALSAIIDGNLTTFFTALVLYAIGTDQIKGFGMTLMLGNITSMFTAIFCARVILEVAERARWIKSLSMMNFLKNPKVDWVRFFRPAIAASALLVIIGLIATVARGKGLFDIDLAGGTSVTFFLKEPLTEEQVREKLDAEFEKMTDPKTNSRVDHNVYGMTVETQPANTVYKVDSSLDDINLLKSTVEKAFRTADGGSLLKTYRMEVGPVEEVPLTPVVTSPERGAATGATTPPAGRPPSENNRPSTSNPPSASEAAKAEPAPKTEEPASKANEPAAAAKVTEPAEKPSGPAPATESKTENPPQEKAVNDNGGAGCGEDEEQEATQPEAAKDAPADRGEKPSEEAVKKDDSPAAPPADATSKGNEAPAASQNNDAPAPPVTTPSPSTPSSGAPEVTAPAKHRSSAILRFPGSPISAGSLVVRIQDSAKAVINRELATADVIVENPDWDRQDNSTFEEWKVTLPLAKDQAQAVLAKLEESVAGDVVWQTSSQIGGQVSADTQYRAVGALVVSLLIIVAYVWFRFQKVAWGLAAVAALAHDALVMLTAIALSYWLAGPLGVLGVEEFKISLPVVAAFMTILGYSVNDTIVIFDRLREIRGKSPHVTRQMLNDAVNQTLGRNLILAGITLTVVTILYAFGGPGIHAFAFALLTGVLSGCYTTLVIAAPLLHWLLNRGQAGAGSTSPASAKMESRDARRSIA